MSDEAGWFPAASARSTETRELYMVEDGDFYTTEDGLLYTPVEEYAYTPLEPGEIRLVKILSCPTPSQGRSGQNDSGMGPSVPDGQDDICEANNIHIQMVHANVAEVAQLYSAISYCWGDEKDQRKLIVHGAGDDSEFQVLSITATLYAALQRAWQVYLTGAPTSSPISISRLFWADGICIRQQWDGPDEEDDAMWRKEKAEQVKMMGSIYKNAISVMFDLGEDTADSGVAYGLIRDIFQAVNQAARQGRIDSRQRIEPPEFSRYGLPQPEDLRWTAWTRFMARPWFRRVWIVQEYAMARTGWFLFGSQGCSLPWDVISQLVTYMRVLGLDENRRRIAPGITVEERLHAHRAMGAMVTQQVWRDKTDAGQKPTLAKNRRWPKTDAGQKPTLLEALKNTRFLECKDSRDRAYSLLAMCANVDFEHPDLLVDYGKSTTPQSVFERFTRWIIQHDERPIDVLYECGGNRLLGPSWCPSWNLPREIQSLRKLKMEKEVYTAGGNVNASVRFDTRRNMVICKGFIVDQISELGPILSLALDLKPDEGHSTLLAWEAQTRYWLLNNVWPRAHRSQPAHLVQNYRDQRHLEESYIRTLVGNNLELSNTITDQRAAYETLSVTRRALDLDLGVSITTLFPDDASYARYERIKSDFFACMGSLARGRRLCVTHSGSLGIVPARVRPGDAVIVLLGAVAPFTMRRENDSFVILGEGYVEGMMNGEALFDSTASIQDIVIK